MIEPSQIIASAKQYERENLRFRTFLKGRADSDELDAQFLALHNELFAGYDCCQCANCCKRYNVIMEKSEIAPISALLGISPEECANKASARTKEGGYEIKAPCCFLKSDGKCQIQECKPAECRGFPYTNRPDRLHSLMGVMEFAGICPVVFEILQRLKKIYRFR
jgi:Fe-S-cluster containining protein